MNANIFKRYPHDERIAMLLHEMGHAFSPSIKGEAGEFIADDFAIVRNYGKAFKNSLQRIIEDFPMEFSKEITHKRVERIKD